MVVKPPHARVLARWLKRAQAAGVPAHRVVNSRRELTGHVAAQHDALSAEGVRIDVKGRVLDDAAVWTGDDLYFISA